MNNFWSSILFYIIKKKLNNVPKPTDFEYHPNFKKEVEKISDFNCLKKPIDNTIIKELTSSANKVIDNLNKLKKSNLDTLEWKERINYSLFDLFLESVTWLMAHSIMTGAIANAIQENFKISDWIKYFTKPNIILANTITYFSIRPVNSFNYVEKYGWPKIIHQFTLKILFLIKNLLKVTLFSVKIL
ncbi:hypothetical protein [Spiroplasma endosymbiont of Amphimallon solstitiale]|uniref:hypothetical protein n=1 Tax=Spiroplasma endosymbiont of Amphimallon solstitiale TaxID=3066288 RepID=UPI00313B8365